MRRTFRIDEIMPTETELNPAKLDYALDAMRSGVDVEERCQVTTASGRPFLANGTEYAVLLAINKRRFIDATVREDLRTDMDFEVCERISLENARAGVLGVRDLIPAVPDRVKYWVLEY